MSTPTVSELGYEIEEHTTADANHIRAVVDGSTDGYRPGIVGAVQGTTPGDTDEWLLLVYGGADPDLLPLSVIPNGTVRTRSKETALEWINCIARLYVKAAAK